MAIGNLAAQRIGRRCSRRCADLMVVDAHRSISIYTHQYSVSEGVSNRDICVEVTKPSRRVSIRANEVMGDCVTRSAESVEVLVRAVARYSARVMWTSSAPARPHGHVVGLRAGWLGRGFRHKR